MTQSYQHTFANDIRQIHELSFFTSHKIKEYPGRKNVSTSCTDMVIYIVLKTNSLHISSSLRKADFQVKAVT